MAVKAPFNIDKLQQENWKSFQAWLSKNKKQLSPDTNLGVIYAGQKTVGKLLPSGILVGGVMNPDPKPMWLFIKNWNAMVRRATGKLRYDTIQDVMKRINDYPRTKGVQGKANGVYLLYKNMYDCANDLADEKKELLAKSDAKNIWKLMSTSYVANIKGDLAILEGIKKGFRRLDDSKIMISTEIPELMKNPSLSAESKTELKKLVMAYKKVYTTHGELGKEIAKMEKHLKKQS